MSALPSPTTDPFAVTLNRYGIVRFASFDQRLQGHAVQVVHYANGLLRIYSNSTHEVLCELPSAAATYEMNTYPVRKTPTWAIVLAVVGFFFVLFFSLLFLLAKETKPGPTRSDVKFTDPQGNTLVISIN
jgi:hypothetical protein